MKAILLQASSIEEIQRFIPLINCSNTSILAIINISSMYNQGYFNDIPIISVDEIHNYEFEYIVSLENEYIELKSSSDLSQRILIKQRNDLCTTKKIETPDYELAIIGNTYQTNVQTTLLTKKVINLSGEHQGLLHYYFWIYSLLKESPVGNNIKYVILELNYQFFDANNHSFLGDSGIQLFKDSLDIFRCCLEMLEEHNICPIITVSRAEDIQFNGFTKEKFYEAIMEIGIKHDIYLFDYNDCCILKNSDFGEGNTLNALGTFKFSRILELQLEMIEDVELCAQANVESLYILISNIVKKENTEISVNELITYTEPIILKAVEFFFSNDLEILNAIALTFYEYQQFDKVLIYLHKAFEIDPQHKDTLFNLGFILINLGEKELAASYLNRIRDKDTDPLVRRLLNYFCSIQVNFTREAIKHPRVSIGEYTYGSPKIHALNWIYGLKIGKFCSIANGVEIFLDHSHRVDWVSTYPFPYIPDFPEASLIEGHPIGKGDVIIGNDVWIGADALIMSGVTIGDGAVIGSRAVVTRDVPPYSIVVGNPGKVVKYRFSQEVIGQLLQIKWWDWPIEKVKEVVPLLCSNSIDQFINFAVKERTRLVE